MWIFNIIAFFIITIYLSYKTKESMAEVLPVTACGLVMVLYPLAYIRHLSWIDGISLGVIAVSLFFVFRMDKKSRSCMWENIRETMWQPVTVMILCSVFMVCLCVSDRMVLWWDDLNFWATDVKSIYYLNGFAGKYGNTAPEFGD